MKTVAAWFRFPGMLMQYYHEDILKAIVYLSSQASAREGKFISKQCDFWDVKQNIDNGGSNAAPPEYGLWTHAACRQRLVQNKETGGNNGEVKEENKLKGSGSRFETLIVERIQEKVLVKGKPVVQIENLKIYGSKNKKGKGLAIDNNVVLLHGRKEQRIKEICVTPRASTRNGGIFKLSNAFGPLMQKVTTKDNLFSMGRSTRNMWI
ncbi:conserved hypothetical protein [Ricinus communis]|uniref:Uncharacterized protein n=1 Tax=Ricinus communis TaxID=3988 RepID=B9RPG4_RICCO|nr:conserved hypothetical protein [Ricinus communis]